MSKKTYINDVADRVLDGSEIDWENELANQGQDPGDNVSVMKNLRIVDSIARTLRTQTGETSLDDLLKQIHETFDPLLKREPVSDEVLPRVWGKLQIRSLLGSGSFANVYRAFDPALQREVALKLFRSTDRQIQQKMLEEGRRMARIEHPNVVRVYEAEEHDGRVGIWMEVLEGQTFEQLIEEDLLSAGEAALMGRELCKALSAVHAAGLIHSDIKAQNIIRRDDGSVLLTDFGSGVDFINGVQDIRVTGTPLYLAPEILAGKPASIQSDVYSLGVLLFYLVSRDYPVFSTNIPGLKKQHDSGTRASLIDTRPDLPAGFIAVIEKATAVDVTNRYQTMGEMSQALSAFLNEESEPRTKRPPPLLLAATVLVLAFTTWASWKYVNSPSSSSIQYQLDTGLYRINGPGGPEKLGNGSSVAVGDHLSLQLTASKEIFVYIFNEDDKGHAHALYPLKQLNDGNPLSADTVHNLPGARGDSTLGWQVDTAGGVDRIYIVTSPKRMTGFEKLYSQLPPAQLASPQSSLLKPRGVGTVSRASGKLAVSIAPLVQALGELSGDLEQIEGVHYQFIELKHR
jgi:serine/threonine protein kinase